VKFRSTSPLPPRLSLSGQSERWPGAPSGQRPWDAFWSELYRLGTDPARIGVRSRSSSGLRHSDQRPSGGAAGRPLVISVATAGSDERKGHDPLLLNEAVPAARTGTACLPSTQAAMPRPRMLSKSG
jgi:hypothetical protein